MNLIASTVSTPLGRMSVIASETAVHVAAFAEDAQQLRPRLRADLRDAELRRGPSGAAAALADYFDGDVSALDRVVADQPGGEFHRRVWSQMRRVAPGTTVSYTEMAARAGNPLAVRAAASACARNAVCLFVPCHRVVRSDQTLGGYYYGVGAKQRLLEHERCHASGGTAGSLGNAQSARPG